MSRIQVLRTLAVGAILCVAVNSFAEEPKSAALIQSLPADGAWQAMNVVVTINGQEFPVVGTARSVGQAMYNGKTCRFIEYEQTVETPPAFDVQQIGNMTWRLLVPEDEFGEGRDPLSKAVKTWIQVEKREPESVESMLIRDPIFALILQGPKGNLKLEDGKEKIGWQRGNLECAVVSGQSSLAFGNVKLQMTHRVFRHTEVPFGIAGLQQDLNASFGGQQNEVTIRATLRNHGKDAKPKLPELVP